MSLKDMYENSDKPRVVDARAQSEGQKTVDYFDNTNTRFATGFTARTPGETQIQQGSGVDTTEFTEGARNWYDTELDSVGESYSEYNRQNKYLDDGPDEAPGFNRGLYGQ